jgi:hypothetical protein
MKSSFTASRVQPCRVKPLKESGARIKVLEALYVAMNEHILPGDEGVIEHENRVILVKAGGERIIPGRAGRGAASS